MHFLCIGVAQPVNSILTHFSHDSVRYHTPTQTAGTIDCFRRVTPWMTSLLNDFSDINSPQPRRPLQID